MMPSSFISYDNENHHLICQGEWTLTNFSHLQELLDHIQKPNTDQIIINLAAISSMDSAGAWLLVKWQHKFEQTGIKVSLQKASQEHERLLAIIKKEFQQGIEAQPAKIKKLNLLAKTGMNTIHQLQGFQSYLAFVGYLALEMRRIILHPRHWRITSLVSVIYKNGYTALPIIALLSLMIGIVITYQMGLQLRNYGANIYIVDLLGLSILREFGPLITAIMIAGRTGSAFTAQLGIMKVNQEIDALNTMGVTPAELLLLPRIIGLFISLPLLTMWANVFGVIGGMIMANNMLGITWFDFLHRFSHVIPLRSLIIGLGKAPVFALIVASIACFEGIKVQGDAESVGRNTTRSVVLSIFFILVADAIFSIIFSKLKL